MSEYTGHGANCCVGSSQVGRSSAHGTFGNCHVITVECCNHCSLEAFVCLSDKKRGLAALWNVRVSLNARFNVSRSSWKVYVSTAGEKNENEPNTSCI